MNPIDRNCVFVKFSSEPLGSRTEIGGGRTMIKRLIQIDKFARLPIPYFSTKGQCVNFSDRYAESELTLRVLI